MTVIYHDCQECPCPSVVQKCRIKPFSLACDESNDRNSEKTFAILVRYFDNQAIIRYLTNLNKFLCKFSVYIFYIEYPFFYICYLDLRFYFFSINSALRKEIYKEYLDFCDVDPSKALLWSTAQPGGWVLRSVSKGCSTTGLFWQATSTHIYMM